MDAVEPANWFGPRDRPLRALWASLIQLGTPPSPEAEAMMSIPPLERTAAACSLARLISSPFALMLSRMGA
jgi:hypothetical protein